MELKLTEKKKEILARRGINEIADAITFIPRKYYDFRTVFRTVTPMYAGRSGCFMGQLTKLTKKSAANKVSFINFKLFLENGLKINVNILAQAFMYNQLECYIAKPVAVCGTLEYSDLYGYSILNPQHIAPAYKVNEYTKIEPVYTKLSGISHEFMQGLIAEGFKEYKETFIIDKDLEDKYKISSLPDTLTAYKMLHYPENMDLKKAQQRLVVNELTKYACELEEQSKSAAKGTPVILKTLKTYNAIKSSLPYELTADQQAHLDTMINNIKNGRRVSGLLQGDVGCGKTMVAILMMFAMAENGYQAVLMAPTTILAKQHYEEIKTYADRYGIKTAYVDGSLSVSERKKVTDSIGSGEVKLIVGTQTLTTGKITFNKLGMVLIDEEHRFGVEQRMALLKEAENGVNTLLMSATPMPRTLAGTIHGSNTDIYDIKTMPSNRIPVQTAINSSDNVILSFIKGQLQEGRQAYVVCPLIENSEDNTTMEDVRSVLDTETLYRKYFEPEFKVGVLNGKMKKEEIEDIISAYKAGEIHILISTTVIEVGVNVPNASVIVISNAERFGLAAMHQLRGRVGRGDYKSYCILASNDKTNPRLLTMVNCTDGFAIAEEDLKLRGAGDLVGTTQSGFTKQMELVLKYPNLYNKLKELAKEIVDRK